MPARARQTDPATSHTAARAVEASGAAGSHRARVLTVLAAQPGLTAAEIADAAGMERHQPSRRMKELVADGLVEEGRPRECRVLGSKQVTYQLAEVKRPEPTAPVPAPVRVERPAEAKPVARLPDGYHYHDGLHNLRHETAGGFIKSYCTICDKPVGQRPVGAST